MNRRFRAFEIAGAFVTAAIGTLLHFTYEWSGGLPVVGAFSAVDESVFSHVKLFIMGYFLWLVFEAITASKGLTRFFPAKLAGLLTGSLFIIAAYYTYTGALGIDLVWLDIAIFFVAVIAAYRVSYYFTAHGGTMPVIVAVLCAAAIAAVVALSVYWTFYPPELPLFYEVNA